MSRIPQSFVDDLLSRLDIVSIVDSRVKLKKTGKNYAACCPFHQEKTPSFTVSPDKQFYYCFGCGATGNAIGFVMEFERSGFIDTIETLAKNAGMEVPREQKPEFRQQDFKRKKLFQILEQSSEFFQQQLKQHPQKHLPVRYLQNRGLTGQIAKDFGIGFAPPGYTNLLSKLGSNEASVALLVDAGLVIHNPEQNKTYDRFRHRITFPIRDERGRVIGFGGRVLGDDKPKYLNSPETEVFHKGRELYGLYEARQANRKLESLLVVEGYMDVIALAQYGVNNAVATLGTACGEEHLKLAFRYVSEVVFCFDGDNAGRTAAKRGLLNSLPTMEDGRQIKFLFLPEGQDPDSLIRQIGTERFLAQVEHAVPLEEFLFDVAADGINIKTMDGRARFSKMAAPLLGQLPNGVFRELMFDNLARRTGLARDVLSELQQDTSIIAALAPPESPAATEPEERPAHGDAEAPFIAPQPREAQRASAPARLSAPAKPPKRQSLLDLSPAKIATILLLEAPQLLSCIDENADFAVEDDADILRLCDIITYLRKRPESNFNSILGYWGGAKGIEQQRLLASLMANQLLISVKTDKTYNPKQEFIEAIDCLCKQKRKHQRIQELQTLKARGLQNLTAAEKTRFIELTST